MSDSPVIQAEVPFPKSTTAESQDIGGSSYREYPPAEVRADGTEIRKTTCYMCACRCGIRVHLKEGNVRYIDGNPDHPLNRGVICAKGASGIMKQHSPARLTRPLRRKPGSDRGDAEFEEISWDEALTTIADRLGELRKTDPKRFALFTGRDQMQALTGLFAAKFGTPNYAAHGGFCSVNMAAGMIYSIGGSFWEFGGPDLERSKVFVMIGTAEDHHSNPLKTEISKFKRRGGRFISVNPVRTGYSAIADEWIPIRPGTDGALFMAIINELINTGLFDRKFLGRYSNAAQLVDVSGGPNDGLFVRAPGTQDPHYGKESADKMWWDANTNSAVRTHTKGATPKLLGEYTLPDGTRVKPSFQLLKERAESCTAEWAQEITGIAADRIRKLAHELGVTARDNKIELPIQWTDVWGETHESVTGSPVAFHAMRGLAAHSNGFQTIRALSLLMSMLGTIDTPGGFRHKTPFPRPIPPIPKTPNGPDGIKAGQPLAGVPLGFPGSPEDLMVDDQGEPIRIDKAFSWEHPLSLHGMMQNVITNAWRGDPYPVDTLFIFMANMAWNSSMNTSQVRQYLNDKNPDGEYKIPFLVVCDAFASEMVAYADIVLPDTTYLERHDVMSMLDRPISEYDGPVDSVRVPVVPPTGDCRPFQDVIVELGTRLKLPGFTNEDGSRKFSDYADFVVNFEATPGQGFLIGFRGENGDKAMVGEPNPDQWKRYADNNCVYHHKLEPEQQYMRNWNRSYLEWAHDAKCGVTVEPIMINIYSELLQTFRMAADGKREGRQPPDRHRARVSEYFDPLPFWYEPLEVSSTDKEAFPLSAVTQRPMAMYHSWDSQNAWLRQIHTHNHLYVNPVTARAQDIDDGDWLWIESPWGKVKCMCKLSEAVEPGTVWTWNAIGKASGAWGLSAEANEANKGFLLNHLITEELPTSDNRTISNSDPITGQAGWYDVRVRISRASPAEQGQSSPQFKTMGDVPGQKTENRRSWLAYVAGQIKGDRT